MPPDDKDMALFWDMLDAARAAVEFTNDLQYDAFINERKTRNAVERNLEILGEAARRISQSARENHPEIPWRSMIGLRNVLTHEYGEIRYEVLWRVCRDELQTLIRQLQALGADDITTDNTP